MNGLRWPGHGPRQRDPGSVRGADVANGREVGFSQARYLLASAIAEMEERTAARIEKGQRRFGRSCARPCWPKPAADSVTTELLWRAAQRATRARLRLAWRGPSDLQMTPAAPHLEPPRSTAHRRTPIPQTASYCRRGAALVKRAVRSSQNTAAAEANHQQRPDADAETRAPSKGGGD